jgi:hypothetical protein
MKKLMSEALLAASEDENLKPHRSCYIKQDYGYLQVCAIGAIMTKTRPKKIIQEFSNIHHPRSAIIQEICKGTRNACEPLPDNVLKKYPGLKQGIWAYGGKKTWIDLVEYLFEMKYYSFVQIANILRRYDK